MLRPDEELRELESLSMEINIMFCIREKVLLLDISQQNDRSTQEYQRETWTRGHTTVAPVGEKCY